MSNLFTCFTQNKNKRFLIPHGFVKRKRRYSGQKDKLIYISTGERTEKSTENKLIPVFKANDVKTVYRAQTNSQNPVYGNVESDSNRSSTSYSLISQRLPANTRDSFDIKNLAAQAAATVVCGTTKTSVDSLPYGVPMENMPRRSILSSQGDELYVPEARVGDGAVKFHKQLKGKQEFPSFTINEVKGSIGSLRIPKPDYKNFAWENSVKSAIYFVEEKSVNTKGHYSKLPTVEGKMLNSHESEIEKSFSGSSLLEANQDFPLDQRKDLGAAPIRARAGVRRGSYYKEGLVMNTSQTHYCDALTKAEEEVGNYSQPSNSGFSRSKQTVHHVYAANMPDITLPTSPVHQGNNSLIIKHSNTVEEKDALDHVKERQENAREQLLENFNVKNITTAQQTEFEKHLDFNLSSCDRFVLTVEGPDDPKLRWRIVIKKYEE